MDTDKALVKLGNKLIGLGNKMLDTYKKDIDMNRKINKKYELEYDKALEDEMKKGATTIIKVAKENAKKRIENKIDNRLKERKYTFEIPDITEDKK